MSKHLPERPPQADMDRWKAWAEGYGSLAGWETPQSVALALMAALPPQSRLDKLLADLEAMSTIKDVLEEVRHASSQCDRAESALADISCDLGTLARGLEALERARIARGAA